ncbi:hypothetical protein MMC12_001696 [Toensbergia leucococca]|nr:hypothetical protein [Toensbergia leucococca]
MAQHSLRESQLIAFENAAAGHDGVLSDVSGEFVVKPCQKGEIEFYKSTAAHPNFATFIPTFMGTLALSSAADPALVAALLKPSMNGTFPELTNPLDGIAPDSHWAPSNGGKIATESAVVLENVAAGYKKPNILDVKLGRRLWADDAPPAKRARLEKSAEETTSKMFGFRIAGMKTWHGLEVAGPETMTLDGYKTYDKAYGKSLTSETVSQSFRDFFWLEQAGVTRRCSKRVIKRFIEDLQGLENVLEGEESRMYSSSLLFIWEGDGNALDEAFMEEKRIFASDSHTRSNGGEEEDDIEYGEVRFPQIQTLKLIDFAHAEWTPGQGADENVLYGIKNVIQILNELVKEL